MHLEITQSDVDVSYTLSNPYNGSSCRTRSPLEIAIRRVLKLRIYVGPSYMNVSGHPDRERTLTTPELNYVYSFKCSLNYMRYFPHIEQPPTKVRPCVIDLTSSVSKLLEDPPAAQPTSSSSWIGLNNTIQSAFVLGGDYLEQASYVATNLPNTFELVYEPASLNVAARAYWRSYSNSRPIQRAEQLRSDVDVNFFE